MMRYLVLWDGAKSRAITFRVRAEFGESIRPAAEPRADPSCRISCGLVGILALTPMDLGSMRGDYSSMSFDATRARAVWLGE